MNVDTELADLRRRLDDLVREFDPELVRRYELRRPFRREKLGAYRRARMAFGRLLRRLGLRRTHPQPPWVATLKQGYGGDVSNDGRAGDRGQGAGASGGNGGDGGEGGEGGAGKAAETAIVWAVGAEREALRRGCAAIEKVRAAEPGLALVLVTDVVDFASYSRLGWLVELVPTLPDPAGDYAARKLRYLAWRYRDAPALPVSVGVAPDVSLRELIAKARATRGPASTA